MIGRAALPTIAGGVQLAAAVVVLGRPDVGLALGFLSASVPTVAEALASLELLVWALVAASVAWDYNHAVDEANIKPCAAMGLRLPHALTPHQNRHARPHSRIRDPHRPPSPRSSYDQTVEHGKQPWWRCQKQP